MYVATSNPTYMNKKKYITYIDKITMCCENVEPVFNHRCVKQFPKKNLENQKIENVVVDISKSPDCIFFLLQEMREKKQKSLEIFLNFLFSYRFKRSRIL